MLGKDFCFLFEKKNHRGKKLIDIFRISIKNVVAALPLTYIHMIYLSESLLDLFILHDICNIICGVQYENATILPIQHHSWQDMYGPGSFPYQSVKNWCGKQWNWYCSSLYIFLMGIFHQNENTAIFKEKVSHEKIQKFECQSQVKSKRISKRITNLILGEIF